MEDAQELSHVNWRQMEYEWRRAQEGWRDSTTAYFRSYFMNPLEYEMKNYLHVVDSLIEILREAQEATRHH